RREERIYGISPTSPTFPTRRMAGRCGGQPLSFFPRSVMPFPRPLKNFADLIGAHLGSLLEDGRIRSSHRFVVELEKFLGRLACSLLDFLGFGHCGHAEELTEQEIAPQKCKELLHHSPRVAGP